MTPLVVLRLLILWGLQDEADKQRAEQTRKAIGTYMHWKYEADKNLVQRTAFDWTILRPGGLTDDAGTDKVSIGRTHLYPTIPVRAFDERHTEMTLTESQKRDDVAAVLALLADREDAAGLAIDLVGGDTPTQEALDVFVARGVTDWLG